MRTDNSQWRTLLLKQGLINSVFGTGVKELRIYGGTRPSDSEVFDLVTLTPTGSPPVSVDPWEADLLVKFDIGAFDAGNTSTGAKVVKAKTLWTINDRLPLVAVAESFGSPDLVATWCLVWNYDTNCGITGDVGGPGERDVMTNLTSTTIVSGGNVILSSFNLTHWGTE